jgi:hypothetical protein
MQLSVHHEGLALQEKGEAVVLAAINGAPPARAASARVRIVADRSVDDDDDAWAALCSHAFLLLHTITSHITSPSHDSVCQR